MDVNEAAKNVLIAYRQLHVITKDHIGYADAEAHVASYNRLLATLKQCFEFDPSFLAAVEHLRPLGSDNSLPYKMESDGRILLATAQAFIEMYMSPEEKKKAIGFH